MKNEKLRMEQIELAFAGKGKAPCKGCQARCMECHAYCIWYKDYQNVRREFRLQQYISTGNYRGVYRNDYWDPKRGAWRKK